MWNSCGPDLTQPSDFSRFWDFRRARPRLAADVFSQYGGALPHSFCDNFFSRSFPLLFSVKNNLFCRRDFSGSSGSQPPFRSLFPPRHSSFRNLRTPRSFLHVQSCLPHMGVVFCSRRMAYLRLVETSPSLAQRVFAPSPPSRSRLPWLRILRCCSLYRIPLRGYSAFSGHQMLVPFFLTPFFVLIRS